MCCMYVCIAVYVHVQFQKSENEIFDYVRFLSYVFFFQFYG